jgi:hypothetical protein
MDTSRLAHADFESARRKAFWRRLRSWLTRKPNELLSFDEVQRHLPVRSQHTLGPRVIAIDQIVGSVGRYRDFDRAFLPRHAHSRGRWTNVDRAHLEDVLLPPIEVYQVGEIYFVRDGNYRVSVARERGQEFIDAYVTLIEVPIPLTPDVNLHDLIRKQEYLAFLEVTRLDSLRPEARIELTLPGQYEKLTEHIAAHRWFIGERRGAEVAWDEAVGSWYDDVYLPLTGIIHDKHVLREFPGRTEADLYLWIAEHHWFLREAHDAVPLEHAAVSFADRYSERPVKRIVNAVRSRTRQSRFSMTTGSTESASGNPKIRE